MIDGPDAADLPHLAPPNAPLLICSLTTSFIHELSTLAKERRQPVIACPDLSQFTATLAEHQPGCVLMEGSDEFVNRALRLFELMDHCDATLFVCTHHQTISLNLPEGLQAPIAVVGPPNDLAELLTMVHSAIAIHGLKRLARTHLARYAKAVSRLSDAQRDVLNDVCAGKPNKSIASRQQVSLRTVEQRRRRVFDVLGVASAGPLGYEVGFAAALRLLEKVAPGEHPC
ncbi:LuxR C-terminal-related transcriptional regulator [Aeoliella sp. ICT_H6.2]|uniref:LuxR C-terminal-related transcriptional regulator n=1 Tax=Aeoliella straminimaris TaxID=2954799 RepID=A0A9X2FCS0_9BACT|nr:LuxR C-terminal-related transcriptional regulator [Aeoliella straminimaris]MCO6046575.1 LuxR C-terminal-related transcriptional regulator [Aeoliella straminimaris]